MISCSIRALGISHCGRRHVHRRRGVCPHCHRVATLTSCDARAYVNLLFLPLVPLGRKRVVDECDACGKFFDVPLEQWRMSKKERFEQARRQYEAAPRDPATIEEVVATFEAFQDRDAFLDLAPRILRDMAKHASTLRLIGDGYLQFGRYDDAGRVLRRALELEDNAETREGIGEALIRNGRPDEAAPWFEHIFQRGDASCLGYLCLLVQGYQALGLHGRALRVMRRVRRVFPSVARDREFRRNRRIARRYLASGRRVVAPALRRSPIDVHPGGGIFAFLPALAGPALLLAVLGVFLAGWQGKRCADPIWLVNGLSRTYRVRVAGVPYCLHPGRPVAVSRKSNPLDVTVVDSALNIPSQEADIHIPLLTAPWKRITGVVNPDGAAVIAHDTSPGAPLLTGNRLYLMNPAPSETGPRVLGALTPAYALFDRYHDRAGLAAMSTMARHRLRSEPGDERLLRALVKHWSALPESAVEVTEYLQNGIDRHDECLAWQRVYQDLQAERVSLEVLHSDYRARRTSSRTDPARAYLAARVEPDAKRALRELEHLALRNDACGYAVYDLALCRLGEGRREEAIALARRAATLDPDASQFADLLASLDGSARAPSALELGRPTAAFEAIRSGKGDPREWLGRARIPEAANWLLVWIELTRQGNAPGTDAVWQRALGDLRRSVSLAALRAALELENGSTPDGPAPCAASLLPPDDKAIVLVAMGLRHPDVRSRCYDLASDLARHSGFPHDYLARVMAETR